MVIGAIMAEVSSQLGDAFEHVLITLTEAGRPILWGQCHSLAGILDCMENEN